MSTPENPNQNPDAENDINEPANQQDAGQASAGTAQYGQGAQFSQPDAVQSDAANQQNPYDQQAQYGSQHQYGSQAQYGSQNQYSQRSDQYSQHQDQSGQYYQSGGYAQYDQAAYAGAQHPQGAAYPAAGGQPYPATGTQQRPAGFFKSLFDFRFDNFIAVKWAGFIYIIAIVVAALSWLGSIVGGIITGAAAGSASAYFGDGPSFSPWPLLLAIIFGWIIPALWVIFVRLALELIVANVKTAENTRRIADSVNR